jgi:hypothetical protein
MTGHGLMTWIFVFTYQLIVQWVSGLKHPGREVDDSPVAQLQTGDVLLALRILLRGVTHKHRDDFVFVPLIIFPRLSLLSCVLVLGCPSTSAFS